MLVNSILVPFLAFISPFQNMVLDDIRAIRLDSSPSAVGNYRRSTLTGAVITIPRPPPYIENRISRPYTSSLLRTQCIAQKIPTPPPPTCTNKAIRPSFEYAEKSPARPAFPQRRSTCALQPRTVFVGADMTFLHPPSSQNVLAFPEPTLPPPASCRGNSTSTPIAATLFGQDGLLTTLLGLVGIWIGLIVIAFSKPSVYTSAACLDKADDGLDVDPVVPCSALDITQKSVTYSQCGTVGALDEITVDGCQGQGSIEDESVSLPVLTSSAEVETQASHEFPVEKSGHSIVPALVVLSPENVTHSHGPELDSVLPNIPVTSEHSTTTPDAEPSLVPGGPPLLLHSDPVCSFGSLEPSVTVPEPAPFTEVIDNTTTQVITTPVLQPTLNPKAATFVPESLPPRTGVAVPVPSPSNFKASRVSAARPSQVSFHAPAPNGPKDTSLKASIHAPPPQPALSDLDSFDTPEARSLGSSIHAPALVIDNPSEVRSLYSSIHAPDPRPDPRAPEPPNSHLTLSPTAQPFLPGAPKFFSQNYSSTRITIAPAPPRKHRVRSPQMKERKRLRREAKKALAQLAEEGGAVEA